MAKFSCSSSDLRRSCSVHLSLQSLTLVDFVFRLDGCWLHNVQNTRFIGIAFGDHLLLDILVNHTGQVLSKSSYNTIALS